MSVFVWFFACFLFVVICLFICLFVCLIDVTVSGTSLEQVPHQCSNYVHSINLSLMILYPIADI